MTLLAGRLESKPENVLLRYLYHRAILDSDIRNEDEMVFSEQPVARE